MAKEKLAAIAAKSANHLLPVRRRVRRSPISEDGSLGEGGFGDNLEILRRYVKDETVDLVYLDPPFNSAHRCL